MTGEVVLLTGATGFIGSALLERLAKEQRYRVRAATRQTGRRSGPAVDIVQTTDLSSATQWQAALTNVEVVVHLAARVHVMRDDANDPLQEFRRVNVEGTLQLARQAADAGAKRFVFLSSVKVNGEGGAGRYREDDPPRAQDPYGISKYEAEQGLLKVAATTGMELVILRPPLVYGPGVRANFQGLVRAVARGIPLPLGAIRNQRSFVALDNLVDLIVTCIDHKAAANQTFLVSDGEDLSTPELVRRLAHAMNRPARLVPVPPGLLMAAAAIVGKRAVAQRLVSSLQVDISKVRQSLVWTPPLSVDAGLRRTVESWCGNR